MFILAWMGGLSFGMSRLIRARLSIQNQRGVELSLVLYSIGMTLMGLELLFRFVPRSHGIGYTLAFQIWMDRYWKQNTVGFRDEDYLPHRMSGKQRILVLGDSFVAGYGIKDPKDRFSNILGDMVGPNYVVLNAGKVGADTREEYKILTEFPHSPDMILLCYFLNDIEGAARSAGKFNFVGYEKYPGLPKAVQALFENSYLLNFFYFLPNRNNHIEYLKLTQAAYADQNIRQIHLNDLAKFITYSEMKGIPLLVLFFPMLQDLEGSKAMLAPEISFFQSRRVPILDLTSAMSTLTLSERVVNTVDAHPSRLAHAVVGRELDRLLREKNLIQ